MIGSDGEVVRIVGTLCDVTDVKTSEERLLHDAVHDSLTGLPNRQLFADRLDAALNFASQDDAIPVEGRRSIPKAFEERANQLLLKAARARTE